MMALNLANDLLEGFSLITQTQFPDDDDNKAAISPLGSESESGISSLEDSEENKKPLTPSPVSSDDDLGRAQHESESDESEGSSGSSQEESDAIQSDEIIPEPPKPMPMPQREWKVQYEGRNILDLGGNLCDPKFNLRYADLPTNNLQFFFTNRSQYHRLGASGPRQEYSLDNCRCCRFEYPNIPAATTPIPPASSALQAQAQNAVTYSLNNFLKNLATEYNTQNAAPQQSFVPPPTPITKKNVAPQNYNNNVNNGLGNYNQQMNGANAGNGGWTYGANVMNQNTIANLLNLVNMRPNTNNNNNNMRCYSRNNGMQGQYGLYKQF